MRRFHSDQNPWTPVPIPSTVQYAGVAFLPPVSVPSGQPVRVLNDFVNLNNFIFRGWKFCFLLVDTLGLNSREMSCQAPSDVFKVFETLSISC